MRQSASIFIFVLLIHVVILGSASVFAIEQPAVLSLREDKIFMMRSAHKHDLKRDPFNWPASQIKKFKSHDRKNRTVLFAGLSLTGIIWDKKKPIAVINGKMLGVGDTIKGAKVKKIQKESVLLRKHGTNYTLEFKPAILGLEPRK